MQRGSISHVHDGEVFGGSSTRDVTRVWTKPQCVTKGSLTVLLLPISPLVTLVNGAKGEDSEYSLSVAESSFASRNCHIEYVSAGGENQHHVWTDRGVLKNGCAWLVANPSSHGTNSLCIRLADHSGRQLGEGHLLYGSWMRDSQLQRVGIFSRGQLVAEVFLHVAVASPIHNADPAVVDALCGPAAAAAWHDWGGQVGVPLFHRGSGKKKVIAENIMLGFDYAHRKGAKWIEFDVQLTKDNVPLLFHDIEVPVLDGIRTCLRQLTAKQVLKMAPGQLKHKRSGSDPKDLKPQLNYWPAIHEPFPSLKRVLLDVHESISFDLEVKYAHLPEEEDFFIDRNDYADHILTCLGRWAGNRVIYLSTFDPDLCFLLSQKQSRYAVLFLTEAGAEIYPADARRNSFAAAFQWAKTVSLRGIVCDVDAFMKDKDKRPATEQAQEWCEKMRKENMLIFTYGAYNNDRDGFALQKKIGINAICTDVGPRMLDL